MMILVSRCSEKTPDVLPSNASESPVKTRHASQFPLSSRTARPVLTLTHQATQNGMLMRRGSYPDSRWRTVHTCDCFSDVWSEFHRCISAWFVQWDTPVFLMSLELFRGWAIGMVFLCWFVHLDALILGPANFELRIKIFWISLEAIVNSVKFLLESSPPRIVGHEMLFLCHSFAVPRTTKSLFFDDVVLDWSIQSPVVNILAGFAFNQEMLTNAVNDALIPLKKAFWTLHFWNCFA